MRLRRSAKCSQNWPRSWSMCSESLKYWTIWREIWVVALPDNWRKNSRTSSWPYNLEAFWPVSVFAGPIQASMRSFRRRKISWYFNLTVSIRFLQRSSLQTVKIHPSSQWEPEPFKSIWTGLMEHSGVLSQARVTRQGMTRPIEKSESSSVE